MKKDKQAKKNDVTDEKLKHLDAGAVNASSSMDCTGLIPAAPVSEDELQSYRELYDFQADQTDETDNKL